MQALPLFITKYDNCPSISSFKTNPSKNKGSVGIKILSMNPIVNRCTCFTNRMYFGIPKNALKIPLEIPKTKAQAFGKILGKLQ